MIFSRYRGLLLPLSIALAFAPASASLGDCQPPGTPGDDVIVCSGIDALGVNSGAGDDRVLVEAGTGLTLDLGAAPFVPAIDMGSGSDGAEVQGRVEGLTSLLKHESDWGADVQATAELSARSGGLFFGVGDVASLLIGERGQVRAESYSRAEADAAGIAPFLYMTGYADAVAISANRAEAIRAEAAQVNLRNHGSIFARAAPEIDINSLGLAGAEADAPSFGIEIGDAESTATAEAYSTAAAITISPPPGAVSPTASIANEETGRIYAIATGRAEADGPASAESLLNPLPGVATATSSIDAAATADASGIDARFSAARLTNRGLVRVDGVAYAEADAVSDATAWGTLIPFPPWYCPFCPAPVRAYATTDADSNATASGIRAGGGDDLILNAGTGVIEVDARAESYADSIAILVGIPVGWDATADATATAIAVGIDAGGGDNEVTNDGRISVSASAIAEASATVDAFPDDASRFAFASATAIRTGSGNDRIQSSGGLSTSVDGANGAGVAVDSGAGDDQVDFLGASFTDGRIDLGDGNDELTLIGGAVVTGNALAGAGTDRANFNGAGSYSAQLVDFEAVEKRGLGTFRLDAGLPTVERLTMLAGTLSIAGGYQASASGVFEAFVDPTGDAGASGRFVADGGIGLDGALSVTRGPGYVSDLRSWELIRGASVTGGFDAVSLPASSPLLSFELETQPQAVLLRAHASPFDTYATTRVGRNTARYLQSIAPVTTGGLNLAMGELQFLPLGEHDPAYIALSSETHDSYTTAALDTTKRYGENVREQMRQGRALQRDRYADYLISSEDAEEALPPVGALREFHGLQLWLSPLYANSNVDEQGGFTGYDADVWGTSAGVQVRLDRRSFVGISGGYAKTRLDLDQNEGLGQVKNGYATLFGSVWGNRWYGQALLSYGHHRFEDERLTQFGSISEVAKSDHDGQSVSIALDLGLDARTIRAWNAAPYVSVEYAYLSEDAYTERGTGSLLLTIDERDTNSVVSELGLRLSGVRLYRLVAPELTIGWRHDFDVDARTLGGRFVTGPVTPFSLPGRYIQQDAARLGFSLRVEREDFPVHAALQTEAVVGGDAQDYLVSFRLGYLF